jgi:hypothetical protein
MFHWICPECGREIPPAMTECPACDLKPEQASTPAASAPQAKPETVTAAVPPVPPTASNPAPAAAAVLSSEPRQKPLAERPADSPLDPLLAMAERIRAAQAAAKEPATADRERAPQLRELAVAVGPSEAPTLELIPVPALAGATHGATALAEQPQPVALLAPPEMEAAPAPVALADPSPAPLPPPLVPQELREEPAALAQPEELHQEPAPVALAEPVSPPTPSMVPEEIHQEPAPQPVQAAPVALAEPASVPPLPMVPEEIHQEPALPPVQAAPLALTEPVFAPTLPMAREEIHQPAPPPVQAEPVALAEPVPTPPLPTVPEEIHQEPAPPPVQAAPVALAEPVSAPPPPAAQEEIQQEPAPPPVPAAPVALAEPVSPPPEIRQEPPTPPVLPVLPATAWADPITAQPLQIALQASPDSRVEPMVGASASPVQETRENPPSGGWLKLAPLQDYSAAATRAMRPAAPPLKILTADSGPRMTLPGPALPVQLNVRENLRVATAPGERPPKQRRALPGWVISFLVMALLLAAGVGVVFYLLPASHTTADAKTAAPETVTAPAVEASHPLAQSIEVTGFRFVMDPNKKSEIHYLVVNHSATELSDMNVFVTVRMANAKAGQPPLCRFSFRSTGLAPFESKEMTSSIEKLPRPVTLPDWHDLRAEVQIAQ